MQMLNLNKNTAVSGTYKIIDALSFIKGLFGAVVMMVISVYFIHHFYYDGVFAKHPSYVVITGLILVGLFFALWIFILIGVVVAAKGFVVNVEADTLEYPGGGRIASSVLSYFSPDYWLQSIRRYTLKISEIRHTHAYNETKRHVNNNGKTVKNTFYLLDIDGDFGAISFSFATKGKRDELYSLLVQINKMGSPILNR